MALVLADRVKETTTTTSTGAVTLNGAVTGFQSFAAIGDGNSTYYCIASQTGTEWEVGIGAYTAAGTSLSRDVIISSSNSGSIVTFSAGTKDVFSTYPAVKATPLDTTDFTTTATSATPVTLTVSSTYLQYFTGTSTQTIVMPLASTLSLGWSYHICNNSTGNLTVNSSGSNLVATVLPGTTVHITCVDITVTTAAGWDYGFTDFNTVTGTGSVVLSTAPSLTGPVTITEVVGSTALTLTGAIQTTAAPVLNATQTWNNAAITFTGLKFNVTNTASNAASLLMDLQVGGASRVSINNAAIIILDNGASGNVQKVVLNPAIGVSLRSDKQLAWTTSTASSTLDAYITRKAAASLQLGLADAAAPVAQTFGAQSVVAGTSNTAGANFTIAGSQGTGTGVGGGLLFQTAPAGGAGTAQNPLGTYMTIAGNGNFAVGSTNLTNAINYMYGGNTTLSANNWLDGQNGTNVATIYLNRFNGNLIGGATTTNIYGNYFSSIYLPAVGAAISSAFNIFSAGVLSSSITPTNIYSVYAYNQYNSSALGGTVTNYNAFYAASPLFGAAATTNTTNAYQFFASDIVNGAACTITNGYGFYGNVATGTSRWNLYMAGTAPNYLNGGLYLGGTTATSAILTGKAAASLQLGLADASAPVAQTIGVQSVVAGTSNTAGAAFTIRGSQGTGTGVGGNIIFQVAPAGTAGTAQNALATAMTVYNNKTVAVGAAFTVATLPAAGTQGRRAWVTDATAPTFLGALIGGGAVVTPVFDNGTAWVAG